MVLISVSFALQGPKCQQQQPCLKQAALLVLHQQNLEKDKGLAALLAQLELI